jgi:predicted component of type VI protein secretion system
LSIFHPDLVPAPADFPPYDHDRPADSLGRLKKRIQVLLQAMLPHMYVQQVFSRKADERGRDGLEVELERPWIDENLEMFIALVADDMATEDVYRHIYGTDFDMKLASPRRSPRITTMNTRGLKIEIKPVPPGKLPQRQGLHFFKVNKTGGTSTAERIDYWRECETERGIRMSFKEGKADAMEKFKPTLYVVLKG